MKILDEGDFQRLLVRCIEQDDRHAGPLRFPGRPEPALPGNQLVCVSGFSNQQRLYNAASPNGFRKIYQGRLVEMSAGLPRARFDILD